MAVEGKAMTAGPLGGGAGCSPILWGLCWMFSDPLGGVLDVLSRLSAIHPPTRAVVPSSAVSETALYLTLARVLLAVHANAPRYNNLGKWKSDQKDQARGAQSCLVACK